MVVAVAAVVAHVEFAVMETTFVLVQQLAFLISQARNSCSHGLHPASASRRGPCGRGTVQVVMMGRLPQGLSVLVVSTPTRLYRPGTLGDRHAAVRQQVSLH